MLNIATLGPNDRVQHELMVRAREDKTTRNGDPFAVLRFGNASGEISANVWKEQLPWLDGVKAGSIVQVIGSVELYQGKRQLKLTAPPRIVAAGAASLDAFLPHITGEVTRLWSTIDGWRAEIGSKRIQKAVDLFFADDVFRAEFERTPGAPRGHHAQVGGLLQHVVEVGTIARDAARTMGGDVDLVTAGALLHDVGKVEAYAVSAAGFEKTPKGHLLEHIVLGALMLDRKIRALPAGAFTEAQETELLHFILSHHGEQQFGAAVRPMTLEAELLHWADQASANGNNFVEAVDDAELFPGDEEISSKKSWRLDRRVWRRRSGWE